jgi:hypothetical protein
MRRRRAHAAVPRALLLLAGGAALAAPAAALSAYTASTAPLAALQLAQGVLGGRTLRCVHLARDAADSAADGLSRVNTASAEGAALLVALTAVRAASRRVRPAVACALFRPYNLRAH